jgi:hypothetical protein
MMPDDNGDGCNLPPLSSSAGKEGCDVVEDLKGM